MAQAGAETEPSGKNAPLKIDIDLETQDSSDKYCLRDMSLEGAFILSGNAPSIGALVDLRLWFLDERQPFSLSGEVIRAETQGFAVRFNELSPEHQVRINAILSSNVHMSRLK